MLKLKNHILFLLFFCFFVIKLKAQEKISIYNPNFGSTYQGGWKVNGSSYFGTTNTNLILTDDAQYQAGSAFWKRKLALQSNLSFSAYFEFKITKSNSRADGLTFTIQQYTNSWGTNGSGLGYLNLPGKSIAIEYDTYDNNSGTIGESDNHIAIDINGNLHNQNRSDNSSTYPFQRIEPYVKQLDQNEIDLADGNTKYNWVDYDGLNNILEIRISNTTTRPVNATMRITDLNLANTLSGGDVFFGFSAATGLFSEEHAISKFFLRNKYNPFGGNLNDADYQQSTVDLVLSSSNNISCVQPTSVVTVVSSDQLNALSTVGLTFSLDQGQAVISPTTISTNAQTGTASVTISNMTSGSIVLRATSTDGAFETITINKTDIYISGNLTSCVGESVQLSTNDNTSGTWSSTNTNIASISSGGLVNAKYLGGTTTISYTPVGGSNCAVTGTFEVQSITLSSTTSNLIYSAANNNSIQLNVSALPFSGTPKYYKWYQNSINSKSGSTLIATHTSSESTDSYITSNSSIGRNYYYCELETTKGCNTYPRYFTWMIMVNSKGLTSKGEKILYPTVNYLDADGNILSNAGVNEEGEKFTINKVPTLSTIGVSNISSNGFTIGASTIEDAGNAITEKGIVYSLLSNPTIEDNKVASVNTGSGTYTVTLTNASSSSTYYAKPYITNSLGTFYGDQVVATTLAGISTPTGYRYYKWNISDIRTNPSSSGAIQVAEFYFQTNGTDESWTGVTVSARGENTVSAEGVDKLVDGNTSTKWLDFSNSGSPLSWVKFDFGSGNTKSFTGYKWYTANDEISRDPVSWTIQGSNDGTNWTTLDTRTNISVTNSRDTIVGPNNSIP
jgi:hypothetical protein